MTTTFGGNELASAINRYRPELSPSIPIRSSPMPLHTRPVSYTYGPPLISPVPGSVAKLERAYGAGAFREELAGHLPPRTPLVVMRHARGILRYFFAIRGPVPGPVNRLHPLQAQRPNARTAPCHRSCPTPLALLRFPFVSQRYLKKRWSRSRHRYGKGTGLMPHSTIPRRCDRVSFNEPQTGHRF